MSNDDPKYEPKYDIIIPAYTRRDLLKKCLDSIVERTPNKREVRVILIDNACTIEHPVCRPQTPVTFLQTATRESGGMRQVPWLRSEDDERAWLEGLFASVEKVAETEKHGGVRRLWRLRRRQ